MGLGSDEWPVVVVAGVVVIVLPACLMWLSYAPVRAVKRWARANGYRVLEMRRRLLDMGGPAYGGRIVFWVKVRSRDGVIHSGKAYVGSRLNPFSARVTVEWDEHNVDVPSGRQS